MTRRDLRRRRRRTLRALRLAKRSAPRPRRRAARARRAPRGARLRRARPRARRRRLASRDPRRPPAGPCAWSAPAAPRRAPTPARRCRVGRGARECTRYPAAPGWGGRRRGSRRAPRPGRGRPASGRGAWGWASPTGRPGPRRGGSAARPGSRGLELLGAVLPRPARRAARRSGTGSIGPTTEMCRMTPCLSTRKTPCSTAVIAWWWSRRRKFRFMTSSHAPRTCGPASPCVKAWEKLTRAVRVASRAPRSPSP